jgi:hypothetical protein
MEIVELFNSCVSDKSLTKPRKRRRPDDMEDDGIQKLGFTKTQSVVLELVLRMQNQGQNHVVWKDNLFTTQEITLLPT